ncbi:hypothetical protein AQUCO_00500466v1 [Aquilegia coerulea]|uniref:Uncharacterized protein n=1 Tax=Aquilegia coerulea TaxID=218851 RepID=A0A2G5ES57_AQUCA|nr:hypothetical protein AQUCO_00500466v1 [Aquilegia coerulea]
MFVLEYYKWNQTLRLGVLVIPILVLRIQIITCPLHSLDEIVVQGPAACMQHVYKFSICKKIGRLLLCLP